jgi:hypothetical protein
MAKYLFLFASYVCFNKKIKPEMKDNSNLSLGKLIAKMCDAIVNNQFHAQSLYKNLKDRIPNETQRSNAIIKVLEEEYSNQYIRILSHLATLDGSHH